MTKRSSVAHRNWALVAVLLLAFGLRVYLLGAQSLWYDETVSVHLAGKSIPDLVAHTAGDIHPPGYYLLLLAWTRLAGSSDFAAAYLSLFFGLLLVALAYRLGALVFGADVGLVAALLLAVSPYNLWYSQEVRMYTLGAALGLVLLLAIIALVKARSGTLPSLSLLAAYALSAALGLWTLYYFGFLLAAINLMVFIWWLLGWRRGRLGWAWMGRWLLAQVIVLLLYAPWIPVAWRQATQPPVPPWRGSSSLASVVAETWSALSLGQSVEPARVWPLLVLTAVLVVLGLLYKGSAGPPVEGSTGSGRSASRWLLAGYVIIPVFLIYLSSFVIPLYHVRYAFTYSTPFYVLLAAGLAWLGRRWRPALALGLALIFVFSGISVYAYHTDARFASDDHRAAARFLADRWRPGDAILVNAGYAYPALLAYWDGAPSDAAPPIDWRGRLLDPGWAGRQGPAVIQTGTVDGAPSLGWGDPDSDFYAMGRAETAAALERLTADFDRVWVYRIYDTVTDPEGFVRNWLDEHGTRFEDRVFSGESQLRVQGYLTGKDPLSEQERPAGAALADGSLQLAAASVWVPEVEVGGALDLALVWRVVSPLEDDAILFAGLFDDQGQRWAQTDERGLGSIHTPAAWPEGATIRTPLRLPVPPGTPPGQYRLEVGWYRFVEGQPQWLPWKSGERLTMGAVEVGSPSDWAALPPPQVTYPIMVTMGEGLQLLGFDAQAFEGQPGDTLPLDLFWLALMDIPEPGLAVLQLADDAGNVLAEASSAPVGGRASFSGLATGQTLRDPRALTLPGDLAPGVYNLALGRQRPDGAWLPVHRGPFPLGSTYSLATVRVLGRRPNLKPPAIENPVDASIGSSIRLLGYDLQPPISSLQSPVPNLHLTLHWQALAPMDDRYKIFLHLVGAGGASDIQAQTDAYPHLPTTGWVPGEYLSDGLMLDLPGDLPPGPYSLLLGLYDEMTGVRLPVYDAGGNQTGDSLLLEQIDLGE